jgi:hypothetical protein
MLSVPLWIRSSARRPSLFEETRRLAKQATACILSAPRNRNMTAPVATRAVDKRMPVCDGAQTANRTDISARARTGPSRGQHAILRLNQLRQKIDGILGRASSPRDGHTAQALAPPGRAVVGHHGCELRIVCNRLAGQVVQKPSAARELLRDVVHELLVAALGVLARGGLGLFAETRRVREPESNEDREGRRSATTFAASASSARNSTRAPTRVSASAPTICARRCHDRPGEGQDRDLGLRPHRPRRALDDRALPTQGAHLGPRGARAFLRGDPGACGH